MALLDVLKASCRSLGLVPERILVKPTEAQRSRVAMMRRIRAAQRSAAYEQRRADELYEARMRFNDQCG